MLRSLAKTAVVAVSSTVLATLAVNAVDLSNHSYHTMLGGTLFSTDASKYEGICPLGMVYVPHTLNPFCIDRYEVSASDACVYENPKSVDETMLNVSNPKCEPVARKGRLPWTHITLEQAQQACTYMRKRLPTPDEWFVAGFGTPDKNSAWNVDDCNVANNRADGVAETGGGKSCVSSVGAYDMIGNVWEWVSATVRYGEYESYILPQSGFVTETLPNGLARTTGTEKEQNYFNDRVWIDATIEAGMMRGGYFSNRDHAGLYAMYAASPATFSGSALGFRCVMSPDTI